LGGGNDHQNPRLLGPLSSEGRKEEKAMEKVSIAAKSKKGKKGQKVLENCMNKRERDSEETSPKVLRGLKETLQAKPCEAFILRGGGMICLEEKKGVGGDGW